MSDETRIRAWERSLTQGGSPSACGRRMRSGYPSSDRSTAGTSDKHPMQAEENGYWYADVADGACRRSVQVPADNRAGRVQAH